MQSNCVTLAICLWCLISISLTIPQQGQTKAALQLVQTNFVSRTFSVVRSYIDNLLGEEAVPILLAGLTYVIIKTTGVLGLFNLVATTVTAFNK